MNAVAIDNDSYRTVLARFPSGVTIVTASVDGRLFGLTVSAFSAVSLDPPLVLACVDNTSNTLPAVIESGRFTVNFLKDSATETALRFASKDENKFSSIETRESATGPILESEIVAYLCCHLDQVIEAGDHHVLLASVEEAEVWDSHEPLLYCDRKFQRATHLEPQDQ